MRVAETLDQLSPEFRYHLLRNAQSSFGKDPQRLDPEEYREVHRRACRSLELESMVLASPEAKGVVISDWQLDKSLTKVISRYQSSEEYQWDLERNGLDEAGLRHALYRELMFDAVMLRVTPDRIEISEQEVEQFFETHRNQFEVPEIRLARHILITLNPDYPENRREVAHARIEQVATELAGEADRFEQLARRYSECPSAMEGGKLGRVPRGQLFPELDVMLFQLPEGGVSPVLESEIGFHLLLCEQILPGRKVPFAEAAPRIRELLEARHRREYQQAWLATLQQNHHA